MQPACNVLIYQQSISLQVCSFKLFSRIIFTKKIKKISFKQETAPFYKIK